MNSEQENTQISDSEIEETVNLNLLDSLAVNLYRALANRRFQQLLSVLLTEIFVFVLVLIFILPIVLITMRNFDYLPENSTEIGFLLVKLIGIILLVIALGNLFIWQRAKKLKSLLKLLTEVDKYNQIVTTVAVITHIESLHNMSQESADREKYQNADKHYAITALQIARTNLVNALRVEAICRKHKDFLDRRYELLIDIENNFASLMAFEINNQTSEYGRLLNDALKIGMSVHKEVSKLKN